jgi:DNA invertase Pin-like site-specific DNA recombinase
MERKAKEGGVVTKAPLGYKIVNKQLIIDPDKIETVRNIFKEFAESEISLTQLAKKNNLTTAGVKKVLMNTAYLGKTKYADVESQGTHQAIINQELFYRVQTKLN